MQKKVELDLRLHHTRAYKRSTSFLLSFPELLLDNDPTAVCIGNNFLFSLLTLYLFYNQEVREQLFTVPGEEVYNQLVR